MGVHYSRPSSAVNSMVGLRSTVPYNQRFTIKGLIIARCNCNYRNVRDNGYTFSYIFLLLKQHQGIEEEKGKNKNKELSYLNPASIFLKFPYNFLGDF